ncbi:MAG: T9SS type A sorting domain-containing protein [Bacteroidota bacterium]
MKPFHVFIGLLAEIVFIASTTVAQQWQQTASSPKGSGITDLVVKQSNGYLFATTGSFNWPNADTGGVHRSTDGGNTWTRVFPAYIARMIALKQDSILFASVWPTPAQTEGLYYSTNNGDTWTLTWNAGPGNNVFAVAFDSAGFNNYAYAGSRLGIARNTFGGTTGGWSVISNLPLGSWVRDIVLDKRFANRNYVYVAAQHPSNPTFNGTYYSTNQGQSFTRIAIPTGDTVTSLIVVRDSSFASAGFAEELYEGTANGKIYKSNLAAPTPAPPALVYTAAGGPQIAAFNAINRPGYVRVSAALYNDGSGGGGIVQTTDRGVSWISQNQGLPANGKMTALASRSSGPTNLLGEDEEYAGEDDEDDSPNGNNNAGRADVYRRAIGTGVNPISSGIPGGFALHQNYPNPFNPKTEIVYRVPSREFIELRVFDVLGREVATLVNEEKPAGTYEVAFDARLPYGNSKAGQASHLSSGVYFYRLRTGDFVETKKLVLLR